MTEPLLTNPEDVHPAVRPQLEFALGNALDAGAVPPLVYLGAGMTSIVFCDSAGAGWKCGRDASPTVYRLLEAEAEWLRDAARVPGVREHVVYVRAWHPDHLAIEKDCLEGRPGGWGDGGRLWDIHKRIEDSMLPMGWTAPEFKEDSYVFVRGVPILVDAGMAHRIGEVLEGYVEDVLEGRRRHPEPKSDLAFQIRREMAEGTIPKARGERLLAALS